MTTSYFFFLWRWLVGCLTGSKGGSRIISGLSMTGALTMTHNFNPKSEQLALQSIMSSSKLRACICMSSVSSSVMAKGVLLSKKGATKREVTQTKLGRARTCTCTLLPEPRHAASGPRLHRANANASASYRHGFRHGTKNGLLCNLLVSGYRRISSNRDMLVRKIHCDIAVIVRAG